MGKEPGSLEWSLVHWHKAQPVLWSGAGHGVQVLKCLVHVWTHKDLGEP